MDFVLTGNSLGERQREINAYVKKAVSQNVDFNELKDQDELNDALKLAKIDVASKYKRVDYMLEVLKSGDPLLISRVLKCPCLYTEEFSNVVNTEYLHDNVFPFMSIKMKKKMLSTMSIYLRNENRTAEFYTYCLNNKLDNIAYKYLLFTSEFFKLELIKKYQYFGNTVINRDNDYFKHFIKNSFVLAEEFLTAGTISQMLDKLRFLYSVSNEKYLDLLENYYNTDNNSILYFRFGLRHSKDIMKRYKYRVFKNIRLYVDILHKSTLCKYSSVEDAKIYTAALLPESIDEFWREFDNYSYIIELIPQGERYEHIKKIFTDKYLENANKAMDKFDYKYNTLMTFEHREAWALRQFESRLNLTDEDFNWFKYGNFEKGFEEIKKRIMITPDDNKRLNYMNILVESAKNQKQIEKLISYFYERHVNEQMHIKTQFIDKVIQDHNVIEFDEGCWTPFNKILHSLGVYKTKSRYGANDGRGGFNMYRGNRGSRGNRRSRGNSRYRGNSYRGINRSRDINDYKKIALVYYIIKGKDVPRPLVYQIDFDKNVIDAVLNNKLTKEQKEKVYLYLLDFYIEKVCTFENENYNDGMKEAVRKYVNFIADILHSHIENKRPYPDIISKFVSLDWDYFKSHPYFISLHGSPEQSSKPKRITQMYLLRKLKEPNQSICEDDLPLLIKEIDRKHGILKLDMFLKKLKVYFHDGGTGLAYKYLRGLLEFLSKEGQDDEGVSQRIIQSIVYSIFQLADEDFKVQFMLQHAPTEFKIKYDKIDEKLLYIRQAVCAYACFSRSPIPMDVMSKYIKGDYVNYCLPIFYSYPVHLPTPLCEKFIESLLNTQLSVQKHGVRLAFQYFTIERVIGIATSAWNKTKNVSLRVLLYTAVFKKISSVDTEVQDKLYDVLKSFTSELREDDDNKVFKLLTSNNLPEKYLDDYIETAWEIVIKFPRNLNNLKRIEDVVRCMQRNLQRNLKPYEIPFPSNTSKQDNSRLTAFMHPF